MKLVHWVILLICPSLFSQNVKISLDSLSTITENTGANYQVFTLQPLPINECTVSSTLQSTKNIYSKENLTDNNDKTAWVEGHSGSGIGEKIRFTFKNNKDLPVVIRIVPGYLKSKEIWYNNNRISKIKIRAIGTEGDSEWIIDEWKEVNFQKKSLSKIPPLPQYIDISNNYIQNMGYGDFIAIEFEIIEVDSKGAKYNDTCISEISFFMQDELIETYSYEEYKKMKH